MAAKHTLGPWSIKPAGDGTLRRIQAKGEMICNAEFANNSSLIAAAPDLLDALEVAHEFECAVAAFPIARNAVKPVNARRHAVGLTPEHSVVI